MLISIALSAIFAVTPCLGFLTNIPSVNSLSNTESNHENTRPDLQAILQPENNENNADENSSIEPNASLYEYLPKITIWWFPTERRVFVGDVEIFINNILGEGSSQEAIDPQNTFIRHPHKQHGSHKEFDGDDGYPPFNEKTRRDDDEELRLLENLKHSDDGDVAEIMKYLDNLNTDIGHTMGKRGIDNIKDDDVFPGPPIDRYRRDWKIVDYMSWLLNDLHKRPVKKNPVTEFDVENETKEITDVNEEISSKQLERGFDGGVKDNEDKPEENISEKKVMLQPVSPELLKELEENFKKQRAKRSIVSESNVLLLIINSDEETNEEIDDDDDLDDEFDNVFNVLQSDTDLNSDVMSIYYFGK